MAAGKTHSMHNELAFIERFLAENAGYVREKYGDRAGLTVTAKSHATDLLTEVDLTVQKRAMEAIAAAYPGDAFVGEEGEHADPPENPRGRCWIMDPIDGTSNFVRGMYPIFGISLAFAEDGVAQAAGVALPMTGDVFLASRGAGAFHNGRPVKVSEVQTLDACRVDVDFSGVADREAMLRKAPRLLTAAGQIRCQGSAVASICQIASNDADAYVHMSLSPWDYAAAQLIVEEAGGIATRLDGTPLRLFDGGKGTLFSNGALHESLLALLDL